MLQKVAKRPYGYSEIVVFVFKSSPNVVMLLRDFNHVNDLVLFYKQKLFLLFFARRLHLPTIHAKMLLPAEAPQHCFYIFKEA